MVEKEGEFIRGDPREINFVNEEIGFRTSIRIDHPEMEQISDDSRKMMEHLTASFTKLFFESLKNQENLAMIGMRLENALNVITNRLLEAALILKRLNEEGRLRKQ